MSLWIGWQTPHLRRVSYRFEIPGSTPRTTVTLSPEVDVELDDDAFSFTQPRAPPTVSEVLI